MRADEIETGGYFGRPFLLYRPSRRTERAAMSFAQNVAATDTAAQARYLGIHPRAPQELLRISDTEGGPRLPQKGSGPSVSTMRER